MTVNNVSQVPLSGEELASDFGEISSLVDTLESRGVSIWLNTEGKPCLEPANLVTAEEAGVLRAQRAALVTLLAGRTLTIDPAPASTAPPVEPPAEVEPPGTPGTVTSQGVLVRLTPRRIDQVARDAFVYHNLTDSDGFYGHLAKL